MPSQTGSYWCTRGHQFSLHTPQGTATTSGHPQNHLHLLAPGPRLHEDDDRISESRFLLLDHESPGAGPAALLKQVPIEGPLSTHQKGTGIPQDIHHKPPSSSHLQETSPLFPPLATHASPDDDGRCRLQWLGHESPGVVEASRHRGTAGSSTVVHWYTHASSCGSHLCDSDKRTGFALHRDRQCQ